MKPVTPFRREEVVFYHSGSLLERAAFRRFATLAIQDNFDRDRILADTPLQRLGDPLDIAKTVAFLASDALFITGEVIVVDGGRRLVS